MKIKLTENAHLDGYNGGFYRFTTKDGKASASGIADEYYTAIGCSEEGKEYRIVWTIADREAFERGDEDCCDWDNPAEIIDLDSGLPVNAEIIW